VFLLEVYKVYLMNLMNESSDEDSIDACLRPVPRGRVSRGELELLPQRRAHRRLLREPVLPPVLAQQEPGPHAQHPGHARAHRPARVHPPVQGMLQEDLGDANHVFQYFMFCS